MHHFTRLPFVGAGLCYFNILTYISPLLLSFQIGPDFCFRGHRDTVHLTAAGHTESAFGGARTPCVIVGREGGMMMQRNYTRNSSEFIVQRVQKCGV